MKLIVNIDEVMYKLIKSEQYAGNNGADYSARAIQRGTPLPKGHGRLIDGTELKRKFIVYGYDYGGDVLDDMPTIIEADKAESEDKEGGDSFD